jgi:hypothetical protein
LSRELRSGPTATIEFVRSRASVAIRKVAAEVELKQKNPAAWLRRGGARIRKPATKHTIPSKATPKLNFRQERFVGQYLKDGNGTQAAIRAGYSEKGADVAAIRMLGNARILAKIRAKQNQILQRTDVSVERILREAACLAFLNPATLFDAEGNLLPMDEMPEEAQRALIGIEVEELFEFDHGSNHRTGNLRQDSIRQQDAGAGVPGEASRDAARSGRGNGQEWRSDLDSRVARFHQGFAVAGGQAGGPAATRRERDPPDLRRYAASARSGAVAIR